MIKLGTLLEVFKSLWLAMSNCEAVSKIGDRTLRAKCKTANPTFRVLSKNHGTFAHPFFERQVYYFRKQICKFIISSTLALIITLGQRSLTGGQIFKKS